MPNQIELFKSILVSVDAAACAYPALERAVRLARGCGARLTITDAVSVPAYARRYQLFLRGGLRRLCGGCEAAHTTCWSDGAVADGS